jgi:hypothetical protein
LKAIKEDFVAPLTYASLMVSQPIIQDICNATCSGMKTRTPIWLKPVYACSERYQKKPVHFTVNAVLPGRRNNPADREKGIRPLSVYNPIHYQEVPELFMDFICSLTGKSPSTTGAGSEGALTKGPFNMLVPTPI